MKRYGTILALLCLCTAFAAQAQPVRNGVDVIWARDIGSAEARLKRPSANPSATPPTIGRGGLRHLILPAITLGWFQVAVIMRLVRSSMLEVLDSEFVKLARVKGIPEWKVVWKHCLRNAAIAPLTVFAIIAGSLITGSVVTETVFTWPGVGLLVVDAVRSRDFQVVQAVVIMFAGIFILCNLLVDILYAYLDPRIRYQ